MFNDKRNTEERLKRVEGAVSNVDSLDRKLKNLTEDLEGLNRRVRELSSGDLIQTVISEVKARIDKEALIREVVAQLKDEIIRSSRELVEQAIKKQDFSDFIDQDSLESTMAEKIVSQTKLSDEKLIEEVARILVDDDHIDLSGMEETIGEKISERLRVTLES